MMCKQCGSRVVAGTGRCFHRPAAISARSAVERVGVDLGEGRERLDRVAQHVERYVRADGQRGLLEPLAGLRPERVRAGQPRAVAEEGQEAVRLGVGAGVGGGPRDTRDRRAGA